MPAETTSPAGSGDPVSINLANQEDSSSLQEVETSDAGDVEPQYAGPLIGVLVTLISILLAGIFLVVYRGRKGKETPSHSLLTTKIQDKLAASIDFKVYYKFSH